MMTQITSRYTCQDLLGELTIEVVLQTVSHPAFALLNLKRNQVWHGGEWKKGI
jgi:hypothetical protein